MRTLSTAVKIKDEDLGCEIRRSIISSSGFQFIEGIRNFGKLTIREGIIKGVAATFLTQITVYDENNVLLIDLTFERFTGYTRKTSARAILKSLLEILSEAALANQMEFDEDAAYDALERSLNEVFFSESFAAALKWANELGFINQINQINE